MAPSEALVESFKWAAKSVDWVSSHAKDSWLLSVKSLPCSSWFSGYGCAEMAMQMLNSALQKKNSASMGNSFSPSYQFELAARARAASQPRLPPHCCQHVNILGMLSEKDRAELKEVEKNSKNPSEEIWEFLLKKEFVKSSQQCTHHNMMSGLQKGKGGVE